jgi:hypothetical protein
MKICPSTYLKFLGLSSEFSSGANTTALNVYSATYSDLSYEYENIRLINEINSVEDWGDASKIFSTSMVAYSRNLGIALTGIQITIYADNRAGEQDFVVFQIIKYVKYVKYVKYFLNGV